MTSLEKNIRFFIGTTIGNSTALYWINYRREKEIDKLIHRDSKICIEGFHRSGNSFFVMFFKRKNKFTKIAHHTHAAAQVIKAIDYKVPTIVLIRKPEDAIASLIVWDEKLAVTTALKAWILFYQALLQLIDDIQISTFEEVTQNPSEVIVQCNHRFKTEFRLPEFTEKQLDKFMSSIRKSNDPLSAPLPTIEKDLAKQKYYSAIKDNYLFPKAHKLYITFLNLRNRKKETV